jgi:exonuclease III
MKILTHNKNRDVIIVPESKCTDSAWIGATSGISKYYTADYTSYLTENGMRGILILIKKGKGIKVKNVIELSPDILRVDLEIGPNKLTVVGVYGTSSHDDPDFFINLRGHLTNIDNEEVAVLGDFNTTLCPEKDRKNYVTDCHWKSRTVIKEWLETGDYTDAYRALNPEGISMTWKKKNNPQTARLDYILLSNKLAGKLKYCKTVTCPRNISDHHGVEAEITLDKTPPGPGTFRAMPNIERNDIYRRSVKYLIREELIKLANIGAMEKDAEHAKNNNIFEISKS